MYQQLDEWNLTWFSILRKFIKKKHTLRILPPATPPLISSTSKPGLLTSKDRITIMLGGDTKFLSGMGIFFTIYSHTTSILYFSCADIGTTGAPSATVP
jgi:hypothetical protein